MAKSKNNTPQISTIFALLSRPAREVVSEVASPVVSSDPLVRTIVDGKAGFVSLGVGNPADAREERILRLETKNGTRAARSLFGTKSVVAVSSSLAALTA